MSHAAPAFRFNRSDHAYTVGARRIPSVTGMLADCGIISNAFYTEEGAERGTRIHDLAAQYDRGAITDVDGVDFNDDPNIRGWFLAHVSAMELLRPTWDQIEVACVSHDGRWAGRPDRVGRLHGAHVICDIKTGGSEKWHGIQTALQDLLVGELPTMLRHRYGLYLARTGKWKLIPHDDKRDYDRARDVLQACLTT